MPDARPDPETETRIDPLTGDEVVIVGSRQARPNLPAHGCPFCPGGREAPEPYDVRWFPNRWPPLPDGRAEVVLYAPEHDVSLASLPPDRVRRLVALWAERTAALGARDDVAYVLVFENRGPEVGATIAHPHGQIYAFDEVPPAARAELGDGGPAPHGDGGHRLGVPGAIGEGEGGVAAVGGLIGHEDGRGEAPGAGAGARGGESHGAGPGPDDVGDERLGAVPAAACALCAADVGDRLVAEAGGWRAWVPAAATWPYALLIAPVDHLADLSEAAPTHGDLARLLVDLFGRLDRLFDAPMPLMWWWHQRPTDGGSWPGAHVHAHVAPLLRTPGTPRFVAAGELGSGVFFNPVAPVDAAAALRDA